MIRALDRAGAFLRGLGGWRAIAAAWLAGALSALSFAPFGIFPLLLLGLAALVLLLDGAFKSARRTRNFFLLGWAFGFGQFLVGLHWIVYPFMVDPAAHGWQMPFALVLLTGGLGLFPALACMACAPLWDEGPARLLVFGASYALAEWLRGHVFTGFPWNIEAYGWSASLAVLQSAAVLGAYGLTLLTLLLGASLAELTRARRYWAAPALGAGLFVLLWIAGSARLDYATTTFVPGIGLRLVQPDVPQAEKFKRRFVLRNWNRLIDLSLRPSKLRITHLIWPEAAPPFFLEREPVALEQIRSLTESGVTLITGAERYTIGQDGAPRFYNSLAIFGKGGRLLGLYDKFHLVPFGEYLPFASELNRLGVTKLTEGQTGFSKGDGPHTYALPGAPPVGPLICYEILFPGEVVSATRPGWFVNVTDDSWFGPFAGPYQHLSVAQVRAIEEGIPVARAANTGISAVIDPLGRTIATLKLDELGVLDARLPVALASTPYGRTGDLGYWLLVAACGLGALALRRK